VEATDELGGQASTRLTPGRPARVLRLIAALSTPLNRVVLLAAAGGVLSLTVLLLLTGRAAEWQQPMYVLPWLRSPWLVAVLVTLTAASELIAVRLRHDDAVEELTLLDAVVLLNVLLLPASLSVYSTLAGLLVAYAVRRRAPIKVLFNLGTYASACSVTAVIIHVLAAGSGGFGIRLVIAISAGATAFVGVNLVHIAWLLAAISGTSPLQVLREDAQLSVLTMLGTSALVGTVLAMAVSTPVLLPCAVLPALALTYSYRASAERYEEHRRSARVLEFSQVLASGPPRDLASGAFLRLVSEEFTTDWAAVVLHDGTAFYLEPSGSVVQQAVGRDVPACFQQSAESTGLRRSALPLGWAGALDAPLIADGRHLGRVTLGSRQRTGLKDRDVTALSPLAGSLAVALRNAEQMEQLEAETSKLRAVVDQSGDGIVVVGHSGEVQLWSPAMARATGIAADAATGRLLDQLVKGEDDDGRAVRPFSDALARLSSEQSATQIDLHLLRLDGERRTLRLSHAAVFEDAYLVRDVIIVRDLTTEWRLERMKGDFVATVTHELRTPLTPIKGYADLLRRKGDSMPEEKRTRALDVIIDRANHLSRLMEDLLLASDITAQNDPQRSVVQGEADLVALASRALEDFAASRHRLAFEVDSEQLEVACDPARVIQVTANLISNALKYSASDALVTVTVQTLDGGGCIRVSDSGLGIPESELERIFDKFHRVEDPMVMSTGGTGLGLYIARHLAEAMGGALTVQSTLGAGSTFTLRLPATAMDPVAQIGALRPA
jgi:PAS domain S-box-containing protein